MSQCLSEDIDVETRIVSNQNLIIEIRTHLFPQRIELRRELDVLFVYAVYLLGIEMEVRITYRLNQPVMSLRYFGVFHHRNAQRTRNVLVGSLEIYRNEVKHIVKKGSPSGLPSLCYLLLKLSNPSSRNLMKLSMFLSYDLGSFVSMLPSASMRTYKGWAFAWKVSIWKL